MKLNNATVAVIGGTGFIGRHIVEKLARHGARVKILTRNAERAKFLKPLGQVGQITLITGDANDEVALRATLDGAEAVINTVGILAQSRRQRFNTLQADLPHRIGKIISGAASDRRPRRARPRIIHLSAIGANPSSPSAYARTKGQGEELLLKVFPQATILRPSLVFGPGDGFFNRFASIAALAPVLPVAGGGRNLIQPVYVGDVTAAVIKALTDDSTEAQIYELGGPEIMTFRDAMRYILTTISRDRILLPIPFWMLGICAIPMAFLPNPPFTRDQLKLLKIDNVVSSSGKVKTLMDLDITPTPQDLIVPQYLERYKPGGRFAIEKN